MLLPVPSPPLPQDALAEEARELRRDVVQALFACGGGHYGGCLSVLDLLLVLCRTQVRRPRGLPPDPARDRLILSKGHAALALYAVQRRLGWLDEPLSGYGSLGSALEGHPDMTALPAVDFSTGSLGQGLSVGLGMALALRGGGACVWVVLGDGECQEGQVWEAALLAERCGADGLVAVIDANGFQETQGLGAAGRDPVARLAEKWAAFGWRVWEVDGHDHAALVRTFDQARRASGQLHAVVARTVKGKGVPRAEADPLRFHCTAVEAWEHAEMLKALS